MLKMKITSARILSHFLYISEIFVPIEDGKIMVLSDITSLYINILIVDKLNIIKDYVDSNDQFTRKRLYLKTR